MLNSEKSRMVTYFVCGLKEILLLSSYTKSEKFFKNITLDHTTLNVGKRVIYQVSTLFDTRITFLLRLEHGIYPAITASHMAYLQFIWLTYKSKRNVFSESPLIEASVALFLSHSDSAVG